MTPGRLSSAPNNLHHEQYSSLINRRQAELGADAAALAQDSEGSLLAIVSSRERAASRRAEAAAYLRQPRYALRFLTAGRVVYVGAEKSAEISAEKSAEERGWGVVLGWRHERNAPLDADGEAPPDADARCAEI